MLRNKIGPVFNARNVFFWFFVSSFFSKILFFLQPHSTRNIQSGHSARGFPPTEATQGASGLRQASLRKQHASGMWWWRGSGLTQPPPGAAGRQSVGPSEGNLQDRKSKRPDGKSHAGSGPWFHGAKDGQRCE